VSGWGGARIGAGRKPRSRAFALVPRPRPAPPPSARPADEDLAIPPADLPADQMAIWRAYAPLAIERHTLTPATVPAFRLLCELDVQKAVVGRLVDKGALGGLRTFMQLSRQVEALLARFALAPFGKPIEDAAAAPAANPWRDLWPPAAGVK
jgi:hypothetical protein